MKRIAIFGSPGSGKSTLARQLSVRTGIPAIHLDKFYFNSGWEITSSEAFETAMHTATMADYWITDGNYLTESTVTGRIQRADTLILLECPRLVCMWRVIRRVIRYYGQSRPDLTDGCPERFDWAFLLFVWNHPPKLDRTRQLLKSLSGEKTILILRNKREVTQFLKTEQPKPLLS
ncbi:AAA family ATPase [Larkinella insperata]|uniref:AAA family ATPase n=1 Tax=Larkinella insperata TaxID=332158 RepID=A0ABW3QKL7_9BACT